jgi:hypothetical protein
MSEYPEFICQAYLHEKECHKNKIYYCNLKRTLEVIALNWQQTESIMISRLQRVGETKAYQKTSQKNSQSKLQVNLIILEATANGAFAETRFTILSRDERWTQEKEDEILAEYCKSWASPADPDLLIAQDVWNCCADRKAGCKPLHSWMGSSLSRL